MPKQYVPLAGQAVVAHTLKALSEVPRIGATLVVLSPGDGHFTQAVLPRVGSCFGAAQQLWVAEVGGATRARTVLNGLVELRRRGAQDHDWVLVHDAARCLVQPAWINRLIDECIDDEVGGLLAMPLADTLKQAALEPTARIAHTIDRSLKWAAQTPQMFRLSLLETALQQGLGDGPGGGSGITDEASAVEALGHAPRLVQGDAENIKLTYAADFSLAERLLATRTGFARSAPGSGSQMEEGMDVSGTGQASPSASLRIGEGWDTHALVPGRPLVLGGVVIPHTMGLLGHSDADALLHAITDALLGAAGLGDIGRHFPDTDERYRGADSSVLLQEALRRVQHRGLEVVNVDSTVVAQAPRLAAHIPAMQESIARALGLDVSRVNVKAKTAEKMGPVGEGRAIEARAVCLLQARN